MVLTAPALTVLSGFTESGCLTSTTRPGNGPGIAFSGLAISLDRPVNGWRIASQVVDMPAARPTPVPRRNPRRVIPDPRCCEGLSMLQSPRAFACEFYGL